MGDIVGSSDDLNQPLNDQELDLLQVTTLLYYLHESNPDNWLIRDKTDPNAPVSIAACGMSLATIPIGVEREFFDYTARGAPFGPDDGTVAPWVVEASLPFAPEIVIPTVRHFARMDLGMTGKYGFRPSFNQSFVVPDSPTGWWVAPYHFGIDQGPVTLMIENYRTGLLWNIMRRCPAVVAGLRRAGFSGGWLGSVAENIVARS